MNAPSSSMKTKYEGTKKKAEEHLETINELRGQISQMRVDHRREMQDCLREVEFQKGRVYNSKMRCPKCDKLIR